MHIQSIHIDGFGILHEQRMTDLPRGLTVIVGENESGKSTLLEFLRTVLFGPVAKSGKKEVNFYPPLRGGAHGGGLDVVLRDESRFTIQRREGKPLITPEGGAPEEMEPSQRFFAGIERGTFQRVFAVGLEELQHLDVLSDEKVRNRLASATTGAENVPDALKLLDREINELLIPKGRKQRIPALKKQLKDATSQLDEIRRRYAEFSDLIEREKTRQIEVAQSKTRMDEIRRRLSRIEQLSEARPHWIQLRHAREQAKKFEFAREFPPSGRSRFDALNSDIEDAEATRETRVAELQALNRTIESIVPNEEVLARRSDIEILLGERTKLEAAARDLPHRIAECKQLEEKLRQRLRELGPDWDADRLATVDTSIQVRQQVQRRADDIAAANQAVSDKAAQIGPYRETRKQTEKALQTTTAELESLGETEVVDADELARRRAAVRSMRALFHQQDVLTTRIETVEASLASARSRCEAAKSRHRHAVELLPNWLIPGVAVAGLLLAIVAAFFSYPAAGLMVLATFAVVGLLVFVRHKQRQGERDARGSVEDESAQLQRECDDLRARLDDAQQQQDELATCRRNTAEKHGLADPANLADLDRFEEELDRQSDHWRTWTDCRRRQTEAKREHDEATAALMRAEQEKNDAASERIKAEETWREWLDERRFDTAFAAGQFATVIEIIETARNIQGEARTAQRRVRDIEEDLRRIRHRIRELATVCDVSLTGEPGVADLHNIGEALAAASQLKHKRDRRIDERLLLEKEIKRFEKQLAKQRKKLADLMEEAGAENRDEFLRRAEANQQWLTASQKVESEDLALLTIANRREAFEALVAELNVTTDAALGHESRELESQMAQLEGSVSANEREIGSLRSEIEKLSSDRRLADKQLARQAIAEDFEDAIRQWSVRVLCRGLLEQARQVYEEQRQPQVIQRANHYLAQMTGDRYRLISLPGENRIQLEDHSKRRKDEITWSSGLADQTYLAVRLALAREFSTHVEPLPVLLDDVLVRFDESRRLAAAKLLLDFARQQQTLLFSCRRETAEIVRQAQQECENTVAAYYEVAGGQIKNNA
jgi:uncharacterized protein YhaN